MRKEIVESVKVQAIKTTPRIIVTEIFVGKDLDSKPNNEMIPNIDTILIILSKGRNREGIIVNKNKFTYHKIRNNFKA